ncbi:Uncharacterized protein conserved in bacteria [Aedoeadaptatus ivorii]|uniref:Uncharacterized protein conserved in bacteria n=1 Tax=Aedoeadaptatus ivorii TaxID=54006 RepID=A0A3S4Z2Y2_9FIRM|nr:DUF2188 domain-containing protein [Peptoniphilus ivorii]VEJ34525.1 Uncharacterized protein conserved in bacteria [Peptoniphilus ivorii]
MPYTKKDYPPSLKNLDPAVRNKAIDIINALMEDEHMPEDRAIPIGTAQAEKWAQDQGKMEKQNKTATDAKPEKDVKEVLVRYRKDDEKWEVISEGAKRADSLFDLKKDAEARAKEIAGHRGAKVVSYTKEGKEGK